MKNYGCESNSQIQFNLEGGCLSHSKVTLTLLPFS